MFDHTELLHGYAPESHVQRRFLCGNPEQPRGWRPAG